MSAALESRRRPQIRGGFSLGGQRLSQVTLGEVTNVSQSLS